MKTNRVASFFKKLRARFAKKELSITEIFDNAFLENTQRDFQCSLADLSRWFPEETPITIPEEKNLSFLRKPTHFSVIEVTFRMGEHEQQKIYKTVREFGYPLPEAYHQEHIILTHEQSGTTLLFGVYRLHYAMGDNTFSQYFDAGFYLITNDIQLISSLQNQVFEMSPPWLVFDDYVFAYRNHHWRGDWKKFWNRLSDQEKDAYFKKFSAPSDWIARLSTDEFELF